MESAEKGLREQAETQGQCKTETILEKYIALDRAECKEEERHPQQDFAVHGWGWGAWVITHIQNNLEPIQWMNTKVS